MRLDAFLATIIIVSFLITIVMAVGSYGAYKLRERRRPLGDALGPGEGHAFFVPVTATDFESNDARGRRS